MLKMGNLKWTHSWFGVVLMWTAAMVMVSICDGTPLPTLMTTETGIEIVSTVPGEVLIDSENDDVDDDDNGVLDSATITLPLSTAATTTTTVGTAVADRNETTTTMVEELENSTNEEETVGDTFDGIGSREDDERIINRDEERKEEVKVEKDNEEYYDIGDREDDEGIRGLEYGRKGDEVEYVDVFYRETTEEEMNEFQEQKPNITIMEQKMSNWTIVTVNNNWIEDIGKEAENCSWTNIFERELVSGDSKTILNQSVCDKCLALNTAHNNDTNNLLAVGGVIFGETLLIEDIHLFGISNNLTEGERRDIWNLSISLDDGPNWKNSILNIEIAEYGISVRKTLTKRNETENELIFPIIASSLWFYQYHDKNSQLCDIKLIRGTCEIGSFGNGCKNKCHCGNEGGRVACDEINGKCFGDGGCLSGWSGIACNESTADKSVASSTLSITTPTTTITTTPGTTITTSEATFTEVSNSASNNSDEFPNVQNIDKRWNGSNNSENNGYKFMLEMLLKSNGTNEWVEVFEGPKDWIERKAKNGSGYSEEQFMIVAMRRQKEN